MLSCMLAGISIAAFRLFHSYLTNFNQGANINSAYSSWKEILFEVPQGSIFVPLLFNIFYDLFIII